MSNPNYSIDVISHHSKFKNKSLRKYNIEGIETIGAWGDEPFEIKFTNHTYQKIQVKLSLDGTDILTGQPATTKATEDMWVVNSYGTLSLKAWPETHNGGAAFLFTSANNSVALHVHGDMSNRGIIAAAVYTEGYVEPIRINPIWNYRYIPCDYPLYPTYPSYPIWGSNKIGYNSSITISDCSNSFGQNTVISCNAMSSNTSSNLEGLVAAGGGDYVEQKINHVAGLIKPMFTETIRVRYLWWDDLVSKLKENNIPSPHASGFPADKKQIMSLGNTPRMKNSKQSFQHEPAQYSRV